MTQTERRARSGGPDVLIVDDEDDIRELLELTLLRLGLVVLVRLWLWQHRLLQGGLLWQEVVVL